MIWTKRKPCPFCGCKSVGVLARGSWQFAYCAKCSAQGPWVLIEKEGEREVEKINQCIDLWNERK